MFPGQMKAENDSNDDMPDILGSGVPYPDPLPTIKPATHRTETKRQSSIRSDKKERERYEWLEAEREKINERYEKSCENIVNEENMKTTNARHKLDSIEPKLELGRKKALEKFQEDAEYISQRKKTKKEKLDARRRNKELKAKEKANKIRTTGKVPRTCFCF